MSSEPSFLALIAITTNRLTGLDFQVVAVAEQSLLSRLYRWPHTFTQPGLTSPLTLPSLRAEAWQRKSREVG